MTLSFADVLSDACERFYAKCKIPRGIARTRGLMENMVRAVVLRFKRIKALALRAAHRVCGGDIQPNGGGGGGSGVGAPHPLFLELFFGAFFWSFFLELFFAVGALEVLMGADALPAMCLWLRVPWLCACASQFATAVCFQACIGVLITGPWGLTACFFPHPNAHAHDRVGALSVSLPRPWSGPPGLGKTLAVQIVCNNMKGIASPRDAFRVLKFVPWVLRGLWGCAVKKQQQTEHSERG
jgi:hypothetical protein